MSFYDDVMLRIGRARQHAHEAHAVGQSFLEDDSHRLRVEVDHEGQGLIFHEGPELSPAFAVILGEFCSSLRYGFNYIAYALSILDSGENPPPNASRVEFPIFIKKQGPNGFDKNHQIKDLSDEHRKAIEEEQPYDTPEHVRWVIHQCSRWDRHRRLNLVRPIITDCSLDVTGGRIREWFFRPGPIQNGKPIALFTFDIVGGTELNFDPHASIQIVVEEEGTQAWLLDSFLNDAVSDAIALLNRFNADLRATPDER
jgi:hypothetical protein